MRVDALLSRYGYCTRREAGGWVRAGRVRCRGELVDTPAKVVTPSDVTVDGEGVEFADGLYVALHKPTGYSCTHDEAEGEPTVYELVPPRWLQRHPSVQTVGRLDKETSGLLLLTDDGNFLHTLTSPKRHVEKRYEYTTAADVPADAEELFAAGSLMLRGEEEACLPAKLERLAPRHGFLTLREGRYHQVRRMLAAVGAPVETLCRVAVGELSLAPLHLAPGEWRAIAPTDVLP